MIKKRVILTNLASLQELVLLLGHDNAHLGEERRWVAALLLDLLLQHLHAPPLLQG